MSITNETGHTIDIQIKATNDPSYIRDTTLEDGESVFLTKFQYIDIKESVVHCGYTNCETCLENRSIYHNCKQ